jgi:hypothetical protein
MRVTLGLRGGNVMGGLPHQQVRRPGAFNNLGDISCSTPHQSIKIRSTTCWDVNEQLSSIRARGGMGPGATIWNSVDHAHPNFKMRD